MFPLHALLTLNDVTYLEAARALVVEVLRGPARSDDERVRDAFAGDGRMPDSSEIAVHFAPWHDIGPPSGGSRCGDRRLSAGESAVVETSGIRRSRQPGCCCTRYLLNLDEALTRTQIDDDAPTHCGTRRRADPASVSRAGWGTGLGVAALAGLLDREGLQAASSAPASGWSGMPRLAGLPASCPEGTADFIFSRMERRRMWIFSTTSRAFGSCTESRCRPSTWRESGSAP